MRILLGLLAAAAVNATTRASRRERIIDHMRRSVRASANASATPGDAAAYVRQVLDFREELNSGSTGRILIMNGRVFASDVVKPNNELKKHLDIAMTAIHHAAERGERPGNVAYLHRSGASAYCVRDDTGGHLPTTMAAIDPRVPTTRGCGILVPNPYWTSRYTRQNAELVAKAAAARPWKHRNGRAFWRGRLGKPSKKSCRLAAGEFARFSGVALTIRYPEWFDVKASTKEPELPDIFRNAEAMRARGCIDVDRVLGPDPDAVLAGIQGARDHHRGENDFDSYLGHKLLMNFPGSVSGSYSRNLNHLWGTGAVIVMWKNNYSEHYYAGLDEGETHVVVDEANAVHVTKGLHKGDAAERLRAGAAEVQRELVCTECIDWYYLKTLHMIRGHFKTGWALDNATAARDALRGVDCSKLVEHSKDYSKPPLNREMWPRSVLREGETYSCVALVEAVFGHA